MADAILASKICTKCGKDKPITEFCKAKSNKDGLNYWCKTCANAHRAEWNKANPEKAKECTSAWVAKNYERKNASRKAWNNANPERIKAKRAIYRKEHSSKIKETKDAWHAANPGAAKIHNQNRRARQRNSGGQLSSGLSKRLFKLQKGKCACCGLPLGEKYHMDHIMPLALGGTNTDDNIQLLRSICNSEKHAKHPIDFMQSRGFLL